ncbi:hypothetical protein D7036_22485, partial [Aquimarina sp. BL5]
MKKNIIVLFSLIIVMNTSFAKCKAGGIQFYPEQKEISLNSKFIIQGFDKSQKTIENLRNEEIFLISEQGEIINLELLKVLKGQKKLTQAIFKPTKELKPNTLYFLKHSKDSLTEKNKFTKWNSKNKKFENVNWKTTNQKKAELPNSDLKIDYIKTEIISYGCGPSVNAVFNVKNKSEIEIWYKTELVDLSSNENTIYYIKANNVDLNVGHGMC